MEFEPEPEIDASVVSDRTFVVGGGFSTLRSSLRGRERSAASPILPAFIGVVTSWGTLGNGTTCINETPTAFTSQADAAAADSLTAQRDWLVPPSCPGQAGQAAGLPAPEEVALAFWRQVELPEPVPEIDPGFAVTGKTAYLETNSRQSVPFAFETPLGPLQIDARAETYVDWGDGRGRQRYESVGGPWPEGDVTNVYGTAGAVDVVVEQAWTAEWSVAGVTGSLGGLTTTGTLEDFDVRQVQAVIDSSTGA